MHAVDDHAEPRTGRFERRRDRPRLARLERTHRVEEMGEADEPFRQRRFGLRIGRHRMAEADADAGRGELRDEAGRHLLGRQGHHACNGPAARRATSDPPSSGRRISAGSCTPGLPGDRNGPSKWMPSTPGLTGAAAAHGLVRGAHLRRRVGDQRRQQRGGAEFPVRRRRSRQCPRASASSLNRTSPPPLTCTSMKPGASQAPLGSVRAGIPAGTSRRATSADDVGRLRSPRRHRDAAPSPSKTVPASTAWTRALIGCG